MSLVIEDQVAYHKYFGMMIAYHSTVYRLTYSDDSSHWKTDQVISVDTHTNVPNPRHHTTRFHRGHLHAALLEHVPRESIHLGKKLLHAETAQNGVTLHFEDGSSAQGDVLIGADGIRSVNIHCQIRAQTELILALGC
jgi:2-polyprenyl-6-methoxyphenol hydroxylase-like FAD-dependent oxidoreductase